jgi:NAD(P)-dependent dehydrogenase (short-subunit alcohol dehydrogenase family)
VGTLGSTVLTGPTETDPSHVQHEIEFQLYGAITATKAVLPAMREAGTGTLLDTTGAGSVDPVPMVANVNASAAALRNWVINLHKELAGSGIQAAHVAIDVSIGSSDAVVPGFPTAQPRRSPPSTGRCTPPIAPMPNACSALPDRSIRRFMRRSSNAPAERTAQQTFAHR